MEDELLELENELINSADRIEEYNSVGAYDQVAAEQAHRQEIITRIQAVNREIELRDNPALEVEEEIEALEKQLAESTNRMNEYRANGNYDQEAAERADRIKIEEQIRQLTRKAAILKNPALETEEEIARLEKALEQNSNRMKEYKENGNYDQEVAERAERSEIEEQIRQLTRKAAILKNPALETEEEIKRVEDEIRKSADRLNEFKNMGDYDKEAAEYSYRNDLLNKLAELNKQRADILKYKRAIKDSEPVKLEPVKTEPVKVEPVNTEPVKTAPIPPINPGIIIPKVYARSIGKDDEKKVQIKYSAQLGEYSITDVVGNITTIKADAVQGKGKLKVDQKVKYLEKNMPRDDFETIMEVASKKVLKSFDPNLVVILYEQFGKDIDGVAAVKNYFSTIDGSMKKEDLPYKITYDLHGLDKTTELIVSDKDSIIKGKKLGIFDRILLRNMAVANEPVATVIVQEKTKWWKKALIGVVSALTALGAGSVIKQQLAEKNKKNVELEQASNSSRQILEKDASKFFQDIKYEPPKDLKMSENATIKQDVEKLKFGSTGTDLSTIIEEDNNSKEI